MRWVCLFLVCVNPSPARFLSDCTLPYGAALVRPFLLHCELPLGREHGDVCLASPYVTVLVTNFSVCVIKTLSAFGFVQTLSSKWTLGPSYPLPLQPLWACRPGPTPWMTSERRHRISVELTLTVSCKAACKKRVPCAF